jgi:hypothetical protein
MIAAAAAAAASNASHSLLQSQSQQQQHSHHSAAQNTVALPDDRLSVVTQGCPPLACVVAGDSYGYGEGEAGAGRVGGSTDDAAWLRGRRRGLLGASLKALGAVSTIASVALATGVAICAGAAINTVRAVLCCVGVCYAFCVAAAVNEGLM